MNVNSLISPAQHGFLSRHSTCTNLLESVNDWSSKLYDCKSTNVVYLDYANAFGSVSIPKLIYKLVNFGITEPLLSCIRSF